MKFVIIACVTNGAQGILKPYVAYALFLVSFRQAQNLRDELYQAKLRLEKETASLKEANKVLCSNRIFIVESQNDF